MKEVTVLCSDTRTLREKNASLFFSTVPQPKSHLFLFKCLYTCTHISKNPLVLSLPLCPSQPESMEKKIKLIFYKYTSAVAFHEVNLNDK